MVFEKETNKKCIFYELQLIPFFKITFKIFLENDPEKIENLSR